MAVCNLPPVIRDELSRSISSAFQRLMQTLDTELRHGNSVMVSSVADSILRCVKETLAGELSTQNDCISTQTVLPDELWCAIWEHLPFFDCVAVSHVCARWRKAALACPAIWQRVTCYTTVHSNHCQCRDCDSDDAGLCCKCWDISTDDLPLDVHREPTGWDNCPYRPEITNFAAVGDEILQRCADLPLSITLDIAPYYAHRDFLKHLCGVLQPHTRRLRGLCIRSADTGAVEHVLRHFPELPALRDFTVEFLNNAQSFCIQRKIFSREIALPALHTVHLGTEFNWPAGRQIPSVRVLSLVPRYPIHVLRALQGCPGLQRLTLDMTEFKNTFYDHSHDHVDVDLPLEALPDALISLNAVGGCGAAAWVMDATELGNIGHLTLSVSRPHGWKLFNLAAKIAQAVEVLAGSIRIFCDLRDGTLTVRGTDEQGRRRHVQWQLSPYELRQDNYKPGKFIRSFLEPIASRSVSELSIGLSVWSAFVDEFPSQSRSCVQCLTLIVGETFDGDGSTDGSNIPDVYFPALKTIRITAGDRAVSMTGADIATLLRKLGLRVPVDNLTVDHRILAGGRDALCELAAAVDLGNIAAVQEVIDTIED